MTHAWPVTLMAGVAHYEVRQVSRHVGGRGGYFQKLVARGDAERAVQHDSPDATHIVRTEYPSKYPGDAVYTIICFWKGEAV